MKSLLPSLQITWQQILSLYFSLISVCLTSQFASLTDIRAVVGTSPTRPDRVRFRFKFSDVRGEDGGCLCVCLLVYICLSVNTNRRETGGSGRISNVNININNFSFSLNQRFHIDWRVIILSPPHQNIQIYFYPKHLLTKSKWWISLLNIWEKHISMFYLTF